MLKKINYRDRQQNMVRRGRELTANRHKKTSGSDGNVL